MIIKSRAFLFKRQVPIETVKLQQKLFHFGACYIVNVSLCADLFAQWAHNSNSTCMIYIGYRDYTLSFVYFNRASMTTIMVVASFKLIVKHRQYYNPTAKLQYSSQIYCKGKTNLFAQNFELQILEVAGPLGLFLE